MNNEILKFFQLERQIFGVCSKCHSFFRLSDCKIFLKERKPLDWLDDLNKREGRIEKAQESLEAKQEELREKAREKG
jgi:hypothetical protein